MTATLISRARIVTSITTIAVASVLGCACGDDGVATDAGAAGDSGFAGDYMMTAVTRQQGSCGGPGTASEVPPSEVWFRLDDVPLATGPLVAYYHCEALGECDTLYNLLKSFGSGRDGSWLTVVTSSVQPPCTLGYRRRVLTSVDPVTIQIDETVQQVVDDTLSGTACNKDVAADRKDSMPCVAETTWLATRVVR